MGQPHIDPTPFENVDVEAGVPPELRAPTGDVLTTEEIADIESQVLTVQAANHGKTPAEQESVAPEDVN